MSPRCVQLQSHPGQCWVRGRQAEAGEAAGGLVWSSEGEHQVPAAFAPGDKPEKDFPIKL